MKRKYYILLWILVVSFVFLSLPETVQAVRLIEPQKPSAEVTTITEGSSEKDPQSEAADDVTDDATADVQEDLPEDESEEASDEAPDATAGSTDATAGSADSTEDTTDLTTGSPEATANTTDESTKNSSEDFSEDSSEDASENSQDDKTADSLKSTSEAKASPKATNLLLQRSGSEVELQWALGRKATTYGVFDLGPEGKSAIFLGSTHEGSFTIEDAPNELHFYTVLAYHPEYPGQAIWPEPRYVYALAQTTEREENKQDELSPQATDLHASRNGQEVRLDWALGRKHTTYGIFDLGTDGNSTQFIASTHENSYTIEKAAKEPHFYTVLAYHPEYPGQAIWPEPRLVYVPSPLPVPTQVKDLRARNMVPTTLQWDKVPHAKAYEILVDHESMGTVTTTVFIDQDVQANQTKTYEVRALNYNEQENVEGPLSDPLTVTVSDTQQHLFQKVHSYMESTYRKNVSPEQVAVLPLDMKYQETYYWCACATAQSILRYYGIDLSQAELAQAMYTRPPFGTYDKELLKTLNQHLEPLGISYQIEHTNGEMERTNDEKQTSSNLDHFISQVQNNIDHGKPLAYSFFIHTIYGTSYATHDAPGIGYVMTSPNTNDFYIIYLDPLEKYASMQYGPMKISPATQFFQAILDACEPDYLY